VAVIFHQIAAATIQENAKGNDKNGAHSAKSYVRHRPRDQSLQEIQSPTSQQMKMEMENDLSATPLYVEEQPVARLSNG
jgi:hypothetical protein